MKNDEPDEIGRILERAILTCSHQEPRTGLEDRVLHNIFAARARPLFPLTAWACTAAAAALVLILAPQFRHDSVEVPTAGNLHPTTSAQALHKGVPTATTNVLKPAGAGSARAKSLPKRARFPAASPITDEEWKLLVLARSAPGEAVRLSKDQGPPNIVPIRLEALHISPVQIDALQQGAIE